MVWSETSYWKRVIVMIFCSDIYSQNIPVNNSYSKKSWACDLNGITRRWRLVDEYIITSTSGWVILYSYTNPRAVQSNSDHKQNTFSFLCYHFESRARAAVWRAAISIVVKDSQFISIRFNWKMKSWTVTRAIMSLLCEHGVEACKDWVLSHISSIYLIPWCRCYEQTYTPKPWCHPS